MLLVAGVPSFAQPPRPLQGTKDQNEVGQQHLPSPPSPPLYTVLADLKLLACTFPGKHKNSFKVPSLVVESCCRSQPTFS